MDYATVIARLVLGKAFFLFENNDLQAGILLFQAQGSSEAHYAAANDKDVVLHAALMEKEEYSNLFRVRFKAQSGSEAFQGKWSGKVNVVIPGLITGKYRELFWLTDRMSGKIHSEDQEIFYFLIIEQLASVRFWPEYLPKRMRQMGGCILPE